MTIRIFLSTTALMASIAISGEALANDTPAADSASGHAGWKQGQQHRDEELSKLPPEKAKLFKDAMRQAHEKNEPLFNQTKKLRDEQKAILTAEHFDKNAYLAKGEEIDKIFSRMRGNRNAAFISAAAQFSPEERKILASMHSGREHGGMMHDHEKDKGEVDHSPQQ